MKVRGLAAALVLALGTSVGGGAAHAATYLLTVDGCSANCLGSNTEVGKVTVNENSGKLDFSVTLDNGAVINSNGNDKHHALVFDFSTLANLTGLDFQNMSTGFTGSTSGPFSDSPFGKDLWDYAVDYTGGAKQGFAPSSFGFTLFDTANNLTLGMLDSPFTTDGGQHIVFASDVLANGTTGNVGAVFTPVTGGVPEPATWGMMIIGVFTIGAVMRQQRRVALTAA